MKKIIPSLVLAACTLSSAQVNLAQLLLSSGNGSKTSVGFGPAKLDSVDQIAYQVGLGKMWEVAPKADIRLSGDFVFDAQGQGSMLTGGLGLDYYFQNGNASPYFVGTFGFGSDFKKATGFNLYGGLGFMLFRGAKAQLFLEPNVQMILQDKLPKSMGLKFGLVF